MQEYSIHTAGDLPEDTQDPTEKPKRTWFDSFLGTVGTVGSAYFMSKTPQLLAEEAEQKRKEQIRLVAIIAIVVVIAVVIYYSTKKSK